MLKFALFVAWSETSNRSMSETNFQNHQILTTKHNKINSCTQISEVNICYQRYKHICVYNTHIINIYNYMDICIIYTN